MVIGLCVAGAPAAATAQDSGARVLPQRDPALEHATGGWEGWLWRHMDQLAPAGRLEDPGETAWRDGREVLLEAAPRIGRDKHPVVRAELWLALGGCRGATREALESVAGDAGRPAIEREHACVALGLLRDGAALTMLQRLAFDQRGVTSVRVAALVGIGLLGNPGGVLAAATLLTRMDEREVYVAAALALRGLADGGSAEARTLLEKVVKRHTVAPEVRAAALPGLRVTDHADGAGRAGALKLARRIALSESRTSLRRTAALNGDAHPVAAMEWLERVARNDADPLARGYAWCALARLAHRADAAAHRRLVDLLRAKVRPTGEEWLARPLVILALGLASSPRVRTASTLRPMLRASHGADRSAAAVALGLAGDEASRQALASQLSSTQRQDARCYAAIGLALLPYEARTEAFLAEVAGNVNVPEVKSAALRALALMGPTEAGRAEIRKAFRQRNRYVKYAAFTAVMDAGGLGAAEQLAQAWKRESNWEVRALVTRALGREASRDGLPRLRALFRGVPWSALQASPTLRYLARY
jgi:hypothetical protein